MCEAWDKMSVDAIKRDIEDLLNRQQLTETTLKYVVDDVRDIKNFTNDLIKRFDKMQMENREKEQLFLDTLVQMKQLAIKMEKYLNSQGKNGEHKPIKKEQ